MQSLAALRREFGVDTSSPEFKKAALRVAMRYVAGNPPAQLAMAHASTDEEFVKLLLTRGIAVLDDTGPAPLLLNKACPHALEQTVEAECRRPIHVVDVGMAEDVPGPHDPAARRDYGNLVGAAAKYEREIETALGQMAIDRGEAGDDCPGDAVLAKSGIRAPPPTPRLDLNEEVKAEIDDLEHRSMEQWAEEHSRKESTVVIPAFSLFFPMPSMLEAAGSVIVCVGIPSSDEEVTAKELPPDGVRRVAIVMDRYTARVIDIINEDCGEEGQIVPAVGPLGGGPLVAWHMPLPKRAAEFVDSVAGEIAAVFDSAGSVAEISNMLLNDMKERRRDAVEMFEKKIFPAICTSVAMG